MPDLAPLALAQARSQQRIIDQLTSALLLLFRQLDKRDPDASGRYAVRAAEMTRQAQTAAGNGVWKYLESALRMVFDVEAPRASLRLPTDLRGAPQAEVMLRPVIEYRWLLSDARPAQLADEWNTTHFDDERPLDYYDLTPVEAEALVERRIEAVAADDVRLAERTATVDRLERVPAVTGYRRILHPELSESGVCGLCIAAADRIYRKAKMLPIHTRCKCTVSPIVGEQDPGQTLNKADIETLYEAAGGAGRTGLSNVRFTELPHSELGPQLAAA